MKRREVRPDPLKVQTYFFEQLLYSLQPEGEDGSRQAVGKLIEAEASPSPSTTPPCTTSAVSTAATPRFRCQFPGDVSPAAYGRGEAESAGDGIPLSATWAIAPTTHHKTIDRVLWESFTPSSYKTELVDFVSVEHGRTRALAQELKEMWEQVEEVQKRNVERHEMLKKDYLQSLKELQDTVFWRAEDVLRRYELDLTLPSQRGIKGATPSGPLPPVSLEDLDDNSSSSLFHQMQPEAHIKLHFDMTGGGSGSPNSCSSSSSGSAAGQPSQPLELSTDAPVSPNPLSTTQPVILPLSDAPLGTTPQTSSSSAPAGGAGVGAETSTNATTTTMIKKAKAYTKSQEELLDPTKRPHCLRRLFAPLLQRRDQYPKNLTLLFADIQKCQSEVLPKLEESLQNCSMFQIPLHVPFQMIARYMSRYLTQDVPTVALEEAQTDNEMLKMKQEVERLTAFVVEKGGDESVLNRLAVRDRHSLAQDMWQQLLAELKTHHSLHEKFVKYYNAMTKCSADELKRLRDALNECDTCSGSALEQLVRDATESIDVIQRMTQRIKVVVAEVEESYQRDYGALRKSLDSKEYQMEKSEAQQERLARRVREAVKDYFQEQFRYEELAQEVLQERLALAQVQTSYDQVKHAVKTCYDEAIASDARAVKIQKMLHKAEKVRSFMVNACRQHVGRLETDDYYRRHRLADGCSSNMVEWSRCLGDIVSVYEDRFEGICTKGKVSWQMAYLVAGEREFAVSNFLEGREELTKLDNHMAEIKKIYDALDEELPPLVPPGDTPEAISVRAAMRNIDGPLNVQRQLPRLNEDAGAGTSRERIHRLMNTTHVSNPDALAGGEPNAAGRDGPVRSVDQRVKERIPRAPFVADTGDDFFDAGLCLPRAKATAASLTRKKPDPPLLPPLPVEALNITTGLD